jgi:putative transposase
MAGRKEPNKFRNESRRLQSWDYSSPASYFVTICTKGKQHFFGQINSKKLEHSELGRVANEFWIEIPKHFPFVELGSHVVMPNHVHGIITIKPHDVSVVGTQNFASLQPIGTNATSQLKPEKSPRAKNQFGPQSKNLASIVRGYKTGVTKYATMNSIQFAWQERYHDRIVRDERGYYAVTKYIENNPTNWKNDPFNNPANSNSVE